VRRDERPRAKIDRAFLLQEHSRWARDGAKAELIDALAHVAAGRIRPVVHRVLPLEDVAEAHRMLAERSVVGKLVLSIGPSGA
jgi:NADPH:quinone reductase-like Zn-dependent oxidoreductase